MQIVSSSSALAVEPLRLSDQYEELLTESTRLAQLASKKWLSTNDRENLRQLRTSINAKTVAFQGQRENLISRMVTIQNNLMSFTEKYLKTTLEESMSAEMYIFQTTVQLAVQLSETMVANAHRRSQAMLQALANVPLFATYSSTIISEAGSSSSSEPNPLIHFGTGASLFGLSGEDDMAKLEQTTERPASPSSLGMYSSSTSSAPISSSNSVTSSTLPPATP